MTSLGSGICNMAWIFSGPERWVADPWIPWFTGAVSLWHDSISGSTSGISWEKCAHVFLRLLFTSRSPMPNPAIRKSSAITSTPSRSSKNSYMVRCHTSAAEQTPNGIWLHRYCPNGLLNVDFTHLKQMIYKFSVRLSWTRHYTLHINVKNAMEIGRA